MLDVDYTQILLQSLGKFGHDWNRARLYPVIQLSKEELDKLSILIDQTSFLPKIQPLVAPQRLFLQGVEIVTKESEKVENLKRALRFARSVIKSGEPWTKTCEEIFEEALKDK